MWFLSSSLGTFPFLQVLVRHFKPQKLLLVDSNVIFILAQFEQRSKKKKKKSVGLCYLFCSRRKMQLLEEKLSAAYVLFESLIFCRNFIFKCDPLFI